MKLAHLILAHNNPLQLERLVKRLLHPNTDVYIHLDGKSDIAEFESLKSLGCVYFIKNRTAITWANYSMMKATLISFDEILKTGTVYSHINLLSGQDYPLKDAGTIQKFLFENSDKTFMKFRSILDDWQESKSRITMYSMGDFNFPFKYKAQGILNRLLPDRKLPRNLKPYGFSQWLTITPASAKYVKDYLDNTPDVRRFFRMTWGVDELVFQTVLLNSHLKDTIVNDHLRYIKFAKGASRPNTLTIDDADLLVESNKFYARKFDPKVDNKILDFLDSMANKESN